jgi:hypothetical protein
MSGTTLRFEHIREALFFALPEFGERVEAAFGNYYDLILETPEAYPIFEDIVMNVVFELLENGQNSALLTRVFDFFEGMANSPDPNVSRDLLGIAILEPLVSNGAAFRKAWQYMGSTTKELAKLQAISQGRRMDDQ